MRDVQFYLRSLRGIGLTGLLVAALSPTTALAFSPWNFLFRGDCAGAFNANEPVEPQFLGPNEAQQKQLDLVQDLIREKVPAFEKVYPRPSAKSIPVVLVNSSTYKKLVPYLKASYGTQVVFQPDWRNDHGLLRVGEHILDVDTPGARGFGEIHKTGLAWKPIASYLPRMQRTIIEVSYALTNWEYSSIEYYHRARRAAIFRVPFTFGGNQVQVAAFNLLQSGGENCFSYSKGSSVRDQIAELERRLKDFGFDNARESLKEAKTEKLVRAVRQKLLTSDPMNEVIFSVSQMLDAKLASSLPNPKGLAAVDLRKAMGLLVALDASLAYQAVLTALGVTGDYAYGDAAHPRATAILIYDAAANEELFRQGNFKARGIFSSWQNDPLHRPFAERP